MLHRIRAGLSRAVWNHLILMTEDRTSADIGPIRVRFCSVSQEKDWIALQATAVGEAARLFTRVQAEPYRQLLFEQIGEIVVADAGRDKHEARERRVFLRYMPDYTDNYVFLAARLVQIACLMRSQYNRGTSAERNRRAREEQIAFLSLFPEASQVKEWLLRSQECSPSKG